MPEIPRYPAEDDAAAGARSGPRRASWRTYLLVAAGVGLLVLMVVLHLTGVLGPGEH